MGFVGVSRAYKTMQQPEFQGLRPHLKQNSRCISTSIFISYSESPGKIDLEWDGELSNANTSF